MRLPDHVFETLKKVAAKYPGNQPDVSYTLVLNETAWIHRLEGFGLSEKTGGRNAIHPVLGPIAHDILQLPDGTHWDVFGGADDMKPIVPSQGDSIVPNTPRRWLAPVSPGEVIVPGPGEPPPARPPVEPPPASCKFTPCVCNARPQEILDRLDKLESDLGEFIAEKVIDGQFGFLRTELNAIQGKLDQLLGKPGCRLRF